MSTTTAFVVGAGVGFLVARLLIEPSSCCTRVQNGVREKVVDAAGPWAGTLGDVLGLWEISPGLLDLFGVK